jgi:energy-coupling factor transporter ATP-binding protein EcfA2
MVRLLIVAPSGTGKTTLLSAIRGFSSRTQLYYADLDYFGYRDENNKWTVPPNAPRKLAEIAGKRHCILAGISNNIRDVVNKALMANFRVCFLRINPTELTIRNWNRIRSQTRSVADIDHMLLGYSKLCDDYMSKKAYLELDVSSLSPEYTALSILDKVGIITFSHLSVIDRDPWDAHLTRDQLIAYEKFLKSLRGEEE